jgi:ornithine decarboxylase
VVRAVSKANAMSEKIARFLAEREPETPCLVVDLDVVAENFRALKRALPLADIYYAMKANPAPQILSLLAEMGSNFDTASIYEIERCLDLGISATRISYGSTIKKERDIAAAFDHGVRTFAFDSEAELAKLAAAAPGANVYCRILTTGVSADWPLSQKFGCETDIAVELLEKAAKLGLTPFGLSFHVGSQQRDPGQWDVAIKAAKSVFDRLGRVGITLKMLNLGGGFPARYRQDLEPMSVYGTKIMGSLRRHFGNDMPAIYVEPGRSIPGDAGIIQTEVVLIAKKTRDAAKRWIYLDVGRFGGLPETMDEAIKYRIKTPRDGGPTGPVVIAGPTCDEVDVLYDKAGYEMPLDLKVGDKIEVLSAGAYTATYCSTGFNGFPPLKEYYI